MKKILRISLIISIAVIFCFAQQKAEPVYSRHGMVVSPEPSATNVGVEILKQGGNAFDAAAAVGFALAVTYPTAGNLGGGGFLTGLKSGGTYFSIDFRERAPAAASRDMYLDDKNNVIQGMSTRSHRAVGVPGSTDGLLKLLRDHGTLERRQVLAPAIKLAREGFTLSGSLSKKLLRNLAAAKIFFPNGKALAKGETLKQSDLADTLSAISERGRDGFYQGRVADLIVAEMKRGQGLISHEDLQSYQALQREPFVFSSGEYELITMPLPSSGGVTIAQILGLVNLDALKEAGHQSIDYTHILTEAERLAYADRNYYLGDPDFVDVPIKKLTSKTYLNQRRRLIPKGKAGKSAGISHGTVESEETTHFCVADRWGNVAAITYTLNSGYGSGIVVEGAGFILNNQMDNFSAKPGAPNQYGMLGADANSIAASKRMLSSMTPTIVRKNGEFLFTMGSPGGPTIITTVLQIFLNVTLFDMNIREAIDAPRVHHQWLPDLIQHEESALLPGVISGLKAMDYTLRQRRSIGMAAGIMKMADGRLAGHADRRGYGTATGH